MGFMVYLIITLISMFFITSAGAVTSGFLQFISDNQFGIWNHVILFWSAVFFRLASMIHWIAN